VVWLEMVLSYAGALILTNECGAADVLGWIGERKLRI